MVIFQHAGGSPMWHARVGGTVICYGWDFVSPFSGHRFHKAARPNKVRVYVRTYRGNDVVEHYNVVAGKATTHKGAAMVARRSALGEARDLAYALAKREEVL